MQLDIVTAANAAVAQYYQQGKRESLSDICHRIATRHGLNHSTVYGLAYKEIEESNK